MAEPFLFPLRALMLDVASRIPGTAEHFIGGKDIARTKNGAYYVWVPRQGKPNGMVPTVGPGEHRHLMGMDLSADVHCKGVDADQTWGMFQNLVVAIRAGVELDAMIDELDFVDFGKDVNQSHEVAVVSVLYRAFIDDNYVDIATRTTSSRATATIAAVEGTLESVDDLYDSGEYALTIET